MAKQKFLISIILTALFIALLGCVQKVNAKWVEVSGDSVNFTHYAKATSLWTSSGYNYAGRDCGKIPANGSYKGYKIGNTNIMRWKNCNHWYISGTEPVIDKKWGVFCIEHWNSLNTGGSGYVLIKQNIVVDDFDVTRNIDVPKSIGSGNKKEEMNYPAQKLTSDDAVEVARMYAYMGTYSKSRGPGPKDGQRDHTKNAVQFGIWRYCGEYLNNVGLNTAVIRDWAKDKELIRRRKDRQARRRGVDIWLYGERT